MNTITQETTETSDDNVIHLNPNLTRQKLKNIENSIETIKETKREYCDEALEYIMDHLFNMTASLGFLTDNRRVNSKELILIEQLVQSMLYRYHGLEHEFDELANNVITIEDEDEDDEEIEEEVDTL